MDLENLNLVEWLLYGASCHLLLNAQNPWKFHATRTIIAADRIIADAAFQRRNGRRTLRLARRLARVGEGFQS